MAARSIGSLTLIIGLVAIPVKLYTATSAHSVGFNMLHKKCSSRLKQQLLCPVDNVVVERGDTVRGFEYATDQYVRFTDEEIKALEADRPETLDIVDFVPARSIDLLQVEKSQYLGPDKGGHRAYTLFSLAMDSEGVAGVGQWKTRSKDTLVVVRPYRDGLALHQIFYETEVRNFDELELAPATVHSHELELARRLIQQRAKSSLDAARFRDEWAERIKAAVEAKVAGNEYVVPPQPVGAQVIDLMEALRGSVAQGEPAGRKGPKKAAPRSKVGRGARRATG